MTFQLSRKYEGALRWSITIRPCRCTMYVRWCQRSVPLPAIPRSVSQQCTPCTARSTARSAACHPCGPAWVCLSKLYPGPGTHPSIPVPGNNICCLAWLAPRHEPTTPNLDCPDACISMPCFCCCEPYARHSGNRGGVCVWVGWGGRGVGGV